MKKILTVTVLTLALTSGAFAQTNAKNTRTGLDSYAGGDSSVWDMMMSPEGVDVDDATFHVNWEVATPEQQFALKNACTKAQKAKAEYTDMVANRCNASLGN